MLADDGKFQASGAGIGVDCHAIGFIAIVTLRRAPPMSAWACETNSAAERSLPVAARPVIARLEARAHAAAAKRILENAGVDTVVLDGAAVLVPPADEPTSGNPGCRKR
jgi:hypothetical protein